MNPIDETAPIKPATSPYGNTKQISEEIISDTIKAGAPIKSILLRYFNPVGAHPSAEIGELPIGVPQNLIPYLTQTAAGIRPQLTVFGAMKRMLDRPDGEKLEIFNLGTGNGLSVLQLISSFERATGVKVPYVIGERREGDIEKIWADPKKANEVLGWKAEIDIDETMRNAWKWQQKVSPKE